MTYTIDEVVFTYENGIVAGQIWIHDFFLDVYRKKIDLNTEDEFKVYCENVYEEISERLKGVVVNAL